MGLILIWIYRVDEKNVDPDQMIDPGSNILENI